jgi:hypothetical protein
VKADVLALKDPHYHRENFCTMNLGSAWKARRASDGGCAAAYGMITANRTELAAPRHGD